MKSSKDNLLYETYDITMSKFHKREQNVEMRIK